MTAVSVTELQSPTLLAGSTSAVPRVFQSVVLLAEGPPQARRVRDHQSAVLVACKSNAQPKDYGTAVLVSWRTGAAEDPTQRAWGFTFDGHPFYALTLGEQGTVVYDLLTGQWSQFQTEGLPGWNMELGLVWQGRIIAGDQQNPLLWRLEPQTSLDEGFKPLRRIVTGGTPVRQRAFPRHFSLTLTASVGAPDAGQETPTVSLRFSDDAGNTWRNMPDVVLEPGMFSQEVAWRSLGSLRAPGRVFEISDFGGFVRIDGLDADVEGFDEE